MRKTGILLALAIVTIATSGCCRSCRNLFRRGAPCGTTTLTPAMMGPLRALRGPMFGQPRVGPGVVPQMFMPQQPCCPESITEYPCCDPCSPIGMPCNLGLGVPGACDCEVVGQGEWFGGYGESSEGDAKSGPQDTETQADSNKDPYPEGG
ncbi:MAG: hypothetical protein MK171_05740 [Pirellulales bacterium]|nr:hypothetical protein [Pirellulales bacterium]